MNGGLQFHASSQVVSVICGSDFPPRTVRFLSPPIRDTATADHKVCAVHALAISSSQGSRFRLLRVMNVCKALVAFNVTLEV
jgi:hypothetical protein